ncbi:Ribonuclease H-like domain containing protein [Parasponia andersonii]|uniref:Ribonuclease H-like domain containing protein n=1 Tax=Parasponia andersonii TaxID=3476 RepID=A0A2P5DJ40_PARAD|nr:Ribonuclease H-like domain containing protein [Parasponia andersonii]
MTNQVGHRTGDIRHRVSTSSGEERASHGRLPGGNPILRPAARPALDVFASHLFSLDPLHRRIHKCLGVRYRNSPTDPSRTQSRESFEAQFSGTNNEAEYEALLQGLELALHFRVESITVKTYSQLIVG